MATIAPLMTIPPTGINWYAVKLSTPVTNKIDKVIHAPMVIANQEIHNACGIPCPRLAEL